MVEMHSDSENNSEEEEVEGPKSIQITKMILEIERAYNKGKYCILVDKSNTAHVYFGHKATMKEFHKEVVACTAGKKTRSDALDVVRKGFIYSMKNGDTMCISLDKTVPDFNSFWSNSEFPSADIFNFSEFHQYKNYMKIVKTEENFDFYGNPGNFSMQKDFRMCILATWIDDKHLKKLMTNIPGSSKMQLIYIEKGEALDFSCDSIKVLGEKRKEFQGAVKTTFVSHEANENNRL